jgi:hypothetical protein
MKSNAFKIVLVVVLLVAVLFARLYKVQSRHSPEATYSAYHQNIIDPNTALIYTKHARCRMDCRHISEADIRELLREGHINEAKSQQNESPCPTYAIEEDRHKDGVRLRIVFASHNFWDKKINKR